MSGEEAQRTLKKVKSFMEANEVSREEIICELALLKPGQIDPVTKKVMSTKGELIDRAEVLSALGIPGPHVPEGWLNAV